jgi:pyruvate dehydrogenase (quinone)
MPQSLANVMREMLMRVGIKHCYGVVGDALRRNGKIGFIHLRHEEYGVFAAVAEAHLTGNPVDCGTAGLGAAHLFNGLP